MWSCEVFRRKKKVRKSRFRPCFKEIDRMDKKSADRRYSIPNQVRYQLRYTRIFESIIAKKLRKVKNYELAKLWSKKAILTTIRKNDRCIHCAATARFSDDIKIILLGKFPKQARYQLR